MSNKLKGGGVMGQTSAGLTWPVKKHIQVPEMTVMTSPVNTRNLTGTYGPGYGLLTISDVDHRHHGMTMRQKLHNQRGSQIGCAMEEGKETCHRGRRAMEK